LQRIVEEQFLDVTVRPLRTERLLQNPSRLVVAFLLEAIGELTLISSDGRSRLRRIGLGLVDGGRKNRQVSPHQINKPPLLFPINRADEAHIRREDRAPGRQLAHLLERRQHQIVQRSPHRIRQAVRHRGEIDDRGGDAGRTGDKISAENGQIKTRIRECRSQLPALDDLVVDPSLEEISASLDGEALFIRNELHHCRGLRKLHLETARLGLGLQILHCVFFPDPRFDLPVFGADLVASPAGISAAIVDLSPVTDRLPDAVRTPLEDLVLPPFQQVRALPPWGTIFSPYVRFIRPVDREEEGWFVDLVGSYLAILAAAIDQTEPDPPQAAPTIARYQGQLSYCLQQKRNDKTRRVLEKAFSPEWADRYIEELLFDNPPQP